MADRPVNPPSTRPWEVLYDNYEDGTAFITDDPVAEQTALASGLLYDVARNLAATHNAALAEARRLTVEQIRERFQKDDPSQHDFHTILDELAGLNASESPPPRDDGEYVGPPSTNPNDWIKPTGSGFVRDASESDR